MVVSPEDPDRPRGILSSSDREALLAGREEWEETHSRSSYTQRERAIRERTRAALRDSQLLADELPAEEREKIFSDDLSVEVARTIEFLYAGMGGESNFRSPLEWGVAAGELALGNIDHSLNVDPRFEINTHRQEDLGTIIDSVENQQWHQITRPPVAIGFIKLAARAGAIDFKAIREQLEREESTPSIGDQILNTDWEERTDDES